MTLIRTIGIDPGSRNTGYGIVDYTGSRCIHVAHGHIATGDLLFHLRLAEIHKQISLTIDRWQPADASIEDVFVGKNPQSALKLGQARGAAIVAVMSHGLDLTGYPAKTVKQAVTGAGGADKESIQKVVRTILRISETLQADAADGLAIAICHAHSRGKAAKSTPSPRRRRSRTGRGLRL